jgi:hypothetical protein
MMRGTQGIRNALALAALGLVAFAGGGEALERDPAEGEFYTNEEIMELSASERDEYCEKMERTLQMETELYQSRLDSMQVMADTLRAQTLALSDTIRQVNNDLRELRLQRKTLESYTTKGGETLSQLAKLLFGDAQLASELSRANEQALAGMEPEDPLPPGIKIKVPR